MDTLILILIIIILFLVLLFRNRKIRKLVQECERLREGYMKATRYSLKKSLEVVEIKATTEIDDREFLEIDSSEVQRIIIHELANEIANQMVSQKIAKIHYIAEPLSLKYKISALIRVLKAVN